MKKKNDLLSQRVLDSRHISSTTNYRSLSKLFGQIIKFRLDQVMVTNSLLSPQPESQELTRRNKNFLFMSNADPAEGHCLA